MNDKPYEIIQVFEAMALHLLNVGMDDFGEKLFEGIYNGNRLTLTVRDEKGEPGLKVVGGTSTELAEQLVLACLHNISIEHLGAFHLRPLNHVLKAK